MMSDVGRWLDDCYADFPKFIWEAFPWGEGELRDWRPRPWQLKFAEEVSWEIRGRNFNFVDAVKPIRFSTVSGHKVGKTVLCAWIILFLHHTRPYSKGTITAVTSDQLHTKTWMEVKRWHSMSKVLRSISDVRSSKGNMRIENKRDPQNWFARAITAAPENATAIQGQHAEGGSSFYVIDEAAGVPAAIFEAMYGGLSSGESHIYEFGNGTEASGEFHKHHNQESHIWNCRSINALDVAPDNPWYNEQVDEHGLDSDWVRVRVLGKFPSASDLQFIPYDWVRDCMGMDFDYDKQAALVYGVDVAKGGDDSVIYPRRGNVADGRHYRIERWKSRETLEVADRVSVMFQDHRPDMIFVDDIGVGVGCTEAMLRMNLPVIQVNGAKPSFDNHTANIRAMVWNRMKMRIRDGMSLPNDEKLFTELTGVQYKYRQDGRIILESKEDMAKRGLGSPDAADALAYTFHTMIDKRGEYLDPWDRSAERRMPEFRLSGGREMPSFGGRRRRGGR